MTIEIGNQIRGVGSALVGTEVVTTSNDGSSAFTVTSKRKCMLIGSGSNYVRSLPDATTLEVGDEFEVKNASSEFIIVKNSGTASSVFEFVGPGCTLTGTCSGVSTAAGTWTVKLDNNYDVPSYSAIGDSLTVGLGLPYTRYLWRKYTNKFFPTYGVGGEYATALIEKQTLQGAGLLRWGFRESYYPWTLSGITASISGESLSIIQAAGGYLKLKCLPINQKVIISGNYQTATSSRLKIYSASTANILTTTATGDFTVTYTPVADREEIRLTAVSGTDGDEVFLNSLQIELTNRAESANKAVFIWAGINDIIANVRAETIFEALMLQCDMSAQSGSEPVLLSVMPFGAATQYTATRESERVALNTMIERSGYRFVDTSIVASGGSIKAQYDYGDGLHLNAAGYEIIGKQVDASYFGTGSDESRGYDAAAVGGIAVDATPVSLIEKRLVSNTYENIFINSEDLDKWLGVRVANTGYNEITGDATNNTHYKAFYTATVAGTYVVRMKVKPGDKTWIRVSNATKSRSGNFDIGNVALGTMGVGVRGAIRKLSDGYCELMAELPADTQASNSFTIIPYVNDSTASFLGDGTTVNLYVENLQMYKGVLEDDYRYIATAAKDVKNYSIIQWEGLDSSHYQDIGWLKKSGSSVWENPILSTDATQYQYIADTGNVAKYGTGTKLLKFGALANGATLVTATAIHGGEVTVSDGTNRITLPLNYTDGTNTVSIYLSGTSGSGTITVSLTGYTIIGGCLVYS